MSLRDMVFPPSNPAGTPLVLPARLAGDALPQPGLREYVDLAQREQAPGHAPFSEPLSVG